jgi:hypothetical protein
MKINRKPTMRSRRFVLSAAASALLLATAAANAVSYPTTVLGDNPVAYYRLEELAGAATAVDSSPSGFNATYVYDLDINSVPDYPQLGLPGITTNSALFHMYTDVNLAFHHGFVDIPYQPALSPVTGDGQHGAPFSVECWAQPLTQPANYSVPLAMFGRYGTGIYNNASGWNFYQTPGPASYWIFNVKNGPFAQASTILIQPLQWYHLAATFDGSTFLFYVNGVQQVSSGGWTTYLADNGADGQIGAGDNVNFLPFDGGVDEVAFYTNVLGADKILTHYQTGTNSFSGRAFPPLVVQDPASITVSSGSSATFTVIADGATPLAYKWLRGGSPITGATSNPYSFIASYPADNGAAISVVLSNSFNMVTSAVATLTVNGTLSIDHDPFSITRLEGSNSMAAFRVAASGSIPISYQWFKVAGGTTNSIPGATNDTLWLSGLKLADSGNAYYAQVTNAFFVLASAQATLTVNPRTVNVPIAGYAQVVVADHPVAYWRLDEPDGSTDAVDVVGSFTGTYTTSISAAGPAPAITYQVPGAPPKDTNAAVSVSGGGLVTIPYALELNPVTGPWSFETWIKPSSLDPANFRSPFSSMWNKDFGNHIFGWNIYQHQDGYWTLNAFNGGPNGSFSSEFNDHPLDTNKWYHMVITDDLVNLRYYVNNVLGAVVSVGGFGFQANGINGDPAVAGGPTVLGQRSDYAFAPFYGAIDETAVYNYALSPQQIQDHFLYTTLLNIRRSGNNVVLTWGAGALQAAPAVTGTYTNVPGATSPYTTAIGSSARSFRVKLQ